MQTDLNVVCDVFKYPYPTLGFRSPYSKVRCLWSLMEIRHVTPGPTSTPNTHTRKYLT